MVTFQSSGRSWPRPTTPWAIRMRWHELLFMHWPVPAERIGQLVHPRLQVEQFGGTAWIGVVPFSMSGVSLRGLPDLPRCSSFAELNVRTYVTIEDKPGVWFFTLDAANALAVWGARRFFHLNYLRARFGLERRGEWLHYEVERCHPREFPARFRARYRGGQAMTAERDSLEHFLTARYCLYTSNRRGDLLRGDIDHPPWQLQAAEAVVSENSMGSDFGFDTSGTPHLLYSHDLSVVAWPNQRVCETSRSLASHGES